MELLLPFAGFFVAQIAQRIIVPILVQVLGERRFASPSAFDGCTLGIAGGIGAMMGSIFLDARSKAAATRHVVLPYISPWWILLVVALGITIYGLLFLWVLGFGGKKHEWKIVEGRVLNNTNEELHPTFIRERQDYTQTDAYNGYSHYFLELHSDSELLGTNAYNSKEEFKRDIERVREVTNAKRLDLLWCRRVESRKWMLAEFPDEWALFLCGSLDRLGEDDRTWWRGWIYPEFVERVGTEVDTQEALERLARLTAAYSGEMENSNPNIAEFADKVQRLLMSEGPVIALDKASFDVQVNEVRGNATSLLHDGDFVDLPP